MLVKGPPGSGKSTLASELCYRLGKDDYHFNSLYISFESDSEQIFSNLVNSFGWDAQNNHQIAIIKEEEKEGSSIFSIFKKTNAGKIEEKKTTKNTHFGIWNPSIKDWNKMSDTIITAITVLATMFDRNVPEEIKDIIKQKPKKHPFKNLYDPNVLVIDSLNIIPDSHYKIPPGSFN